MDRSFFNIIHQSTFGRRWRYELPNFLPVTSGHLDCSSKTGYLSTGLSGESFIFSKVSKLKAKHFVHKLLGESYLYKKLKKKHLKRKRSGLVVQPKQFTMRISKRTRWIGLVDFGFELHGLGVALLPDNVFTAFSVKVVDGDVINAVPIEVWIRSGRLSFYVTGLGIVRHGTVYLGNRALVRTSSFSSKLGRSIERVRCALLKKKIRMKSDRRYKKKVKRKLRKSYFVWLVSRREKLIPQSKIKISSLKKRLILKRKKLSSKWKWRLHIRRKLKLKRKLRGNISVRNMFKHSLKFRRSRKFRSWFLRRKSRWTRNWFKSYRIKFDRIKLRNKKKKMRKNVRWNKIFKIFKRQSKSTLDLTQTLFLLKNKVFARRFLLKTLKYLKWRNNPVKLQSSFYHLWRRSAFVNYKLVKTYYSMFYLPQEMERAKISWWYGNYEPLAKGKFVRKKTKSGRIYKRLNSVLRVL